MQEAKAGAKKLKIQGHEQKKRSFCRWSRDTCYRIIQMTQCVDGDPDQDALIEWLHERLRLLVTGQVPLEELVITCSIKDKYKSKSAHQVKLLKKIRKRDGRTYVPGERVAFVLTSNSITGNNTDHPDHVRDLGLPIDYRRYIDAQFLTPVASLIQEPAFARVKKELYRILGTYRAAADGNRVKLPRPNTAAYATAPAAKRRRTE